jgi:hypothetical protein
LHIFEGMDTDRYYWCNVHVSHARPNLCLIENTISMYTIMYVIGCPSQGLYMLFFVKFVWIWGGVPTLAGGGITKGTRLCE